jgi:hypothetical protein
VNALVVVHLLCVVVVPIWVGVWLAAAKSLVSALAFVYFVTPPYGSLKWPSPGTGWQMLSSGSLRCWSACRWTWPGRAPLWGERGGQVEGFVDGSGQVGQVVEGTVDTSLLQVGRDVA